MKKIVFATNNSHKLEELRKLTEGKIEILSLKDINCDDDIPETADTLEGNALIKARWVKNRYGYDCFADDTGLEVEALNGAPGVYSARYAGDGHDSQANMKLLLSNMTDKDNRKARFRTVVALIEGDDERLFEGIVNGLITYEPKGTSGFGYDPIFQPEGHDVTFAEMNAEDKNSISHRGRAVAKLIDYFSL
ncbi:MAG: non-canonical purine NTP diphosphatase [Muribaculaceae bacterium]|nr:non-canonical purine NTP diphosphatase [Muribaculaceae bacterium]MDE6703650.1 non-canonical purine NTP diphosphatase [Muribaculaceae bacterium]